MLQRHAAENMQLPFAGCWFPGVLLDSVVQLSPSSPTPAGFVLNKNGQCIFFLDANGVSAAVPCQHGAMRLRRLRCRSREE